MNRILLLCGLVVAAAAASAADDPRGVAAIAALGRLNGTALACQDKANAQRAKQVMLERAPRGASIAEAFDKGTDEGFARATGPGGGCPEPAALGERMDYVVDVLKGIYPALAEGAK